MSEKEVNIATEDKTDAIAQLNAEKMLFDPNAELEVKEVLEKFALITYDIPATKEGAKVRAEFLEKAKFQGAIMHTESVYLAPWSVVNDLGVLKAAGVGKIRIFISVPMEKDECKEITREYDKKIAEVFKEAEERFEKISKHVEGGQYGIAHKMMPKTTDWINALKKAAIARGSQHLFDRWEELNQKAVAMQALLGLLPPKKVG
jgi:pyruvate-formate lyase